jgi:energy-coupling factor transporter ATP-binding protein EcfA2
MSTLALGTLHIEVFRGLRGVELLNPGRFNLLVGPNNSGKTSALEAIAYFCRPTDPAHWGRLSQGRLGVRSVSPLPERFLACFPKTPRLEKEVYLQAEGAQHQVISARVTCQLRDLITEGDSLFPKRRARFEWRAEFAARAPDVSSLVLDTGQASVSLEPYAGPSINHQSVHTTAHRADESYAADWSALAGTALQGEVVEIIQALEPDIVDFQNVVRLPQGSSELEAIHKRLGACALSMFGDGLRRALVYALGLIHARGGVLLIDEVEMALHVSALERVYGWLREMCERLNVQLFVTTHSLEAVEALLGATPSEDTVCYQLGEQGRVVRRWQGALLGRVVRRRGLDVR